VDQDGRVWRPYHRAVEREDHQAAGLVQQRRLKPTPVTFEELRRYVRMNGSRLEEGGLELEHARDFYVAKAPAVARAARRQHQEPPILTNLNVHVTPLGARSGVT